MQSPYKSAASPSSLTVSGSRRSRISQACMACRRRKIKCNGDLDGCAHCKQTEQQCRYEPVSDGDKLRARSYKRKLIQRRQQTRVLYDGPMYLEPAFLACPYGMASTTAGFYALRSAVDTVPAHRQQYSPIFHPATPPMTDTDSYTFFVSPSSETSTQLQPINSNTSFPYTILAPTPIESLSSLSSSPSGSESTVMTPIGASTHMHFPGFVGDLQVYTVPCIDTVAGTNDIAGHSGSSVESTPSAFSQEYSTLSSSHLFFYSMMTEFQITASGYKPTVDANTSTLAGAFA
ncbi:C6 transcription factor [Pseudozyma hubeiensis SY62]|uniref:C6 transcription factor n=1 Tax=Pseudozyma hubeiensis (strain SY62) TaxID=1305764 RepID=R9P414_PSEHS|nr:C6 transcription factor [Pseudozyma hubeiensis SY62]GAC95987.1 C6 transcription factor [Pseudozyma hubeiensis SY62]